jgi:S-DNA-T family DNA segregation ATPase FtsK/SpoIIIE
MIEANQQDLTEVYPAVPNIDDQIVPRLGIRFDIFVYREQYYHAELGPDTPTFMIDGKTLSYDQNQLLLDGRSVDPAIVSIPDVVVVSHDEVQVLATSIPTTSILVADTPGAEVRYTTRGFLLLKRISPQHFEYTVSEGIRFYANGQRTESTSGSFVPGDQLLFDGLLIMFGRHQFKLGLCDERRVHLEELVIRQVDYVPFYPVGFPEFHRSPRIILNPPRDKIQLENPSAVSTNGKNSLLKAILPPLAMVAASFATTLLSHGNPIMSLGMGGASLMTGGLTASAYFTNKKEDKVKKADHADNFENYMVGKWSELTKLADQQRAAAIYHNPNLDTITDLIDTYSSRLYEKTTSNGDYLSFSLGLGRVPATYQINYSSSSNQDDPEAKRVQEMAHRFSSLPRMPITTTLDGQTLGLVGRTDFTQQAVASILLQIAAFHSYRDVQFIALVPENSYAKNWQQWRWLPHFQLQELNVRGLVHDAQSKDMVLTSFYQLITKRKQTLKEKGSDALVFAPHYIFVILDDGWLNGHQLNEYLSEDMSQYGVSVIWIKEDEAMLPETVTTFVRYDNQDAAEMVNENNQYVAQEFNPMALPTQRPLDQVIRTLAGLKHVEAEKNAIPESISFMELYGVKHVDELHVPSRWEKADTSRSLAVPLGVRGKDDIVYLNLHERAHGPHGLLAGTTGSGKSEVLQSYILSLAVNFAPEDVGFLPIDFKGGGMANLFKNLPHLLGSITNLDGAGSARALASIHAELEKRQRLFRQFGVNHINGYTKLYKKGKTVNNPAEKEKFPDKPLPHLFLISDEFAELKSNEPDFMAELVSTARIGRSLGVHLILATQKPSGVVDDQIWSNSRFKIALKVQDVADSNEILKTPDAASITQPGRGYLQVGNNEIYELFQSAYSGATYNPDVEQKERVDERIWRINNLGQYELLTQDLSDQDDVQNVQQEKITELTAVVDYIAREAKADNIALPDKPWLPPLSGEIENPTFDYHQAWEKNELDLSVPIGVLDIPTAQKQQPFDFNLENLGHTVIFGSPGFGKSIMLQTIVFNLARHNTPDNLVFQLFDFGTNGLISLRKLPHVADIVTLAEEDKLLKFLRLTSKQLDTRKQAFKEVGVTSIEQYVAKTHHKLPIIVNVLDGYDAVKEVNYQERIDIVLDQILREGASLGMYLIVTGLRSNTFKVSMMSNIPTRIALFLVEETGTKELMGHDALTAQEIPGRFQIKLDQILAGQIYLPVSGKTDLERLDRLESDIQDMADSWTGNIPAPVPMVPTALTEKMFYDNTDVQSMLATGNIPFGLDKETTEPVAYQLQEHPFFAIINDLASQESLLTETLLNDLLRIDYPLRKVMVDVNGSYESLREGFDSVISRDEAQGFFNDLRGELENRKQGAEIEQSLVYIPEFTDFIKVAVNSANDIRGLLREGYRFGIHLLFQADKNKLTTAFDEATKFIKENLAAGLIGSRINDQQFIHMKSILGEPEVADDEDHFFVRRDFKRIKLVGGNGNE